jgi:hypothetical protein
VVGSVTSILETMRKEASPGRLPRCRCGRRLFEDSRRWRARTAAHGHAPAYVRALASAQPAGPGGRS